MTRDDRFKKLEDQTLFLAEISEELNSVEYGEGVSFNLPNIKAKIDKKIEFNMLELQILGYGCGGKV